MLFLLAYFACLVLAGFWAFLSCVNSHNNSWSLIPLEPNQKVRISNKHFWSDFYSTIFSKLSGFQKSDRKYFLCHCISLINFTSLLVSGELAWLLGFFLFWGKGERILIVSSAYMYKNIPFTRFLIENRIILSLKIQKDLISSSFPLNTIA